MSCLHISHRLSRTTTGQQLTALVRGNCGRSSAQAHRTLIAIHTLSQPLKKCRHFFKILLFMNIFVCNDLYVHTFIAVCIALPPIIIIIIMYARIYIFKFLSSLLDLHINTNLCVQEKKQI